ncbi:MAG: alternative ribosome rescue aminoacyl-tRNA hydrolase ArfB [Solidesulfovibrio sp.]
MDTSLLTITGRVAIPLEELTFSASRSSGPGGQNVNKVSTRVTLWFDLDQSPSLSVEDKQRIRDALGGRIGKDGMLRIIVQQTRSQSANKEIAIERFAALLRTALTPVAARKKTRATFASKLRRLDAKKRQGSIKRERARSLSADD